MVEGLVGVLAIFLCFDTILIFHLQVLVLVFFFHLSLASSETSVGLVLSQVDRVNSQGPYFMQFKVQGEKNLNHLMWGIPKI